MLDTSIQIILKLFITINLLKLIKHDEKYKVVIVKDVLSLVILCIILAYIKGTINVGSIMITISCLIISSLNIMSLADGIIMGSLTLLVNPIFSIIMLLLVSIRIISNRNAIPLVLPIAIGYWLNEIVELLKRGGIS